MSTRVPAAEARPVHEGYSWFGLIAAPVAWAIHGLLMVFVSSQACRDGDGDWGVLSTAGVRTLLIVLTLGFLGLAAAGAIVSLRRWRLLSGQRRLTEAQAPAREEFVAFGGFLFSAVLLIGILWAGVPLILLDVCIRTR